MSIWKDYEEKLDWIADFRYSLNEALGMLRQSMNYLDRDDVENSYHLFESALTVLQKLRTRLVELVNKAKIVKKAEKKEEAKKPEKKREEQKQKEDKKKTKFQSKSKSEVQVSEDKKKSELVILKVNERSTQETSLE